VDLNELIRNMSELLRHALGERAQIETRLEADWWILCDRNQMESVILNLANNARDAMPDGGKLILETANAYVSASSTTFEGTSRGDYVRFTLRDTGTGMSDEVRGKAIDPFFTTKPQGKGTGLGLSMSFGYIRQSNGYFEIDSEVGKGTTITIMMPKCDAETSAFRA
jgi:signal transduction histidine kinase